MSNAMRSMIRGSDMVAMEQQIQPVDTGAVFNGNVRVWLMTQNPANAYALGQRLHGMGLPMEKQLIQKPRTRAMLAFNPKVRPVYSKQLRRPVPVFLRYFGDGILLETDDWMDNTRFFNWLNQKRPNAPEPEKMPSLTDLADAGEIQSFDAG